MTHSSALRTTLASAAALSTAVLPFFLLGALSLSIQDELGITETAIGALGTVLFVSEAVTATPAGLLVERIGAGVALRLGVVVSGLAAGVIGLVANAWWQLALPMMAAGFGVALIDTGAARAFSDRIRTARQGLAFGMKEASIPAASMLAGLSLPTLAAALGWRASFVAALGVAVVVLFAVPSPGALRRPGEPSVDHGPSRRIASAGVIRFAAGLGMGTGSATAGTTFLVPALVADGFSEATSGLVLAAASITSILMRLAMGWAADRDGARPLASLGLLLLSGAPAALFLASSAPQPVLVLASLVLLGGGWGWTGLAFLAVVRANPTEPAAAAGVVLTGLGVGGALGPLAFGAVADRLSFSFAWIFVAVAMLTASLLVHTARRELEAKPVP